MADYPALFWHTHPMLGFFWRSFTFSFDRWAMVVMVCMKLHNICIDQNAEMPSHRFFTDVSPGDEWRVYDDANKDDIFHNMTNKLEQLAIVRPAHAQCNSCTN